MKSVVVTGPPIGEVVIGVERAAEDPHEVDASHVLVGQRLEHDRTGGTVRVDGVRAVQGRGAFLDDEVQQQFDADALVRLPDEHRVEASLGDAVREHLCELGVARRVPLQVAHQELVVVLDDGLDEELTVLPRLLVVLARDVLLDAFAVLELDGVEVEQVDHAGKILGDADGHLDGRQWLAVELAQCVDVLLVASLVEIELVQEDHARDAALVAFAPQLVVLGLDPHGGVHDEDRRVRGCERRVAVPHDLGTAGAVDDVDLAAVEVEAHERDGERVPAVDLLRLEVHGGRRPARGPIALAGGGEHGFDHGGFAGSSVAQQDHVANLVGRNDPSHVDPFGETLRGGPGRPPW